MEYNFFFCEICNRNQIKNKRHIYSKKHRERLDFLLTRQNEKIIKLSTFLDNIKIVDDDIEQPEIWCLFCKTTIKSSNSKIACEHIFLHLSYENHIDSINEFWQDQRPDKKKWKKEQFYLDKTVIDKFLERSKLFFIKYIKNKENKNMEIIKKTKDAQIMNDRVIKPMVNISSNINEKPIYNYANKSFNDDTFNNNNNNNNSYRTVKAFGENLTCININRNAYTGNNIHNNNSVPLWMIDSSDSESNSEDERLDIKLNIHRKKNDNSGAGPSIDLYLDHKEKKRKSKLNPNRLGSVIDRDKKISKSWIPNFGGIWNSGPRSSTRKEFLKNLNNNNKKSR